MSLDLRPIANNYHYYNRYFMIKLFPVFLLILLNIEYVVCQESNFYDVLEAYKTSIPTVSPSSKESKMFNRWANFYGPRVYPSGDHIPMKHVLLERANIKALSSQKAGFDGDWSYLGPDTIPDFSGGAGRLNCLEFHPNNSQIMWVGAPNGGLWKTIDGGLNWSSNTDLLPNLGVTDIAVDPLNPDNMYIATGDGYGYPILSDKHWGGTYTTGIMKSVDGGLTWNLTGLTYQFSNNVQIFQLIINPLSPNILYATGSDGVYKSIDAALNWTKVMQAPALDIAFKTDDPNTILTSRRNGGVWKSTDAGATWSPKLSSSNEIALAVTKADPNRVYAWLDNGDLQISYDAGETWSYKSTPDYGSWYYMALEASQTNPDEVIVGNLDLSMSLNAGTSWNIITDWLGWSTPKYVHADNREIRYDPSNPNTIYAINDGGIFKSTNNGTTWTDLSHGIHVMQLYRFGNSQTDPAHMMIGAQDNGQNLWRNGDWSMTLFADGMESIIDPWNPGVVYATYQNGGFSVSTDYGQSFSDINLGVGAWTIPLEINPSVPNRLYAGLNNGEIVTSTNQGQTWTNYGNLNSFDYVQSIATCPSEPTTMYALTGDVYSGGDMGLHITKNDGSSWNELNTLPTLQLYPSDVVASPNDASKVWVTYSGYDVNEKVLFSNDYGVSWTNITGSLPKVPVNCILHDGTANNGVYIGTDLGVFYRNDSLNSWKYYSEGMPNVIINELEIISSEKTIRAATYGRGIWQSPIYGQGEPNSITENTGQQIEVYPTIVNDQINIYSHLDNFNLEIIDMNGKTVFTQRSNSPNETVNLNLLSKGTYFLKVMTGEHCYKKKIIKL